MLHRNLTWLCVTFALASCADLPPNEVVYTDSRAVVAAPPPARVEVVAPAPAPNWTWVPGHWRLESGQHVWETGHWVEPRPGQTYVQAYWSKESGRWVYHEAHWQPMVSAQGIVPDSAGMNVTVPPPAPRVEQVPPSPGPNFIWVSGYWQWQTNQYVWVPGAWEASRPGWYYAPAYWVHDGPNWRFVAGSWQRY